MCNLELNQLKNDIFLKTAKNVSNRLVLKHSVLIRNLIKLKGTAKLTVQGEWVCLKDSKYIMFEILAIWLAQPAGASTALPGNIC